MSLRLSLARVSGTRLLAEEGRLYDKYGRNISYDWLNQGFIPSLPELMLDAKSYLDQRVRQERRRDKN